MCMRIIASSLNIKCFHCSKLFRCNELHVHETDYCPRRPTVCKYCKQYIPRLMSSRMLSITTVTGYVMCGKLLTRGEHVSLRCPLSVIDCKFKSVGSEAKVLRKDMAAHLSSSATSHLSLVTSCVSDLSKSIQEHARDIRALQTETNQLHESIVGSL